MLPGFRFLFAAIVLSISILVFGLGAAALLRAAHEEVASNPAWHAAPDATFTQQAEATRPVLAMLRVDPLPAQPKASDDIAAVASPAEQAAALAPTEQVAEVAVPAEQAAVVSVPVEPEKIAALKPEETSQPAAARPEIAVSEGPAPSEAAPADPDAAAGQTKIASAEQGLPPATEAAPAASETPPAASTQARAPASPQTGIATAKIAALGDPTATTDPQPRAKTDSATPDRSIIRKRQRARRAAQRRRIALLLARQAAQLALLQAADPFAQPQLLPILPAAAARKH